MGVSIEEHGCEVLDKESKTRWMGEGCQWGRVDVGG